ncbi:MAG: Flp pilus assembly complex ATPase component TadA [Lachnospiraceae bacterium]|nr:Flp pilus assembly complex ATPase component TadA [Lachnospiraceae bacterium]
MAGFRKKIRIGDALISEGMITEEQLNNALEVQKQKPKGTLIGETLVELGYVKEVEMAQALHRHLQVEYVDLRKVDIDEKAVRLITEPIARKYKLIPFGFSENDVNKLKVAMVDPQDFFALDDISIMTDMKVEAYISTASQISAQIDRHFGKQQATAIAEQYKKEQEVYYAEEDEEDASRREDVENSPIVVLVKNLIEQAVRQRASDIHIEPFENLVRVRYRVDGVLREIITYDKALFPAIIARLKIISGMDISEKRKPQDGRITIDVDHKEYDIRVSNLPTVYGEKVVMRLASKEGFKRQKSELGLRPEDLEKFDNILKNPNGIILVTGPTGSGKSTTLYTALSELSTEEVNVITVEDPVEANVDGVNQVQVNNKADMTFANALRSILRQDPDVIMIGEIRDGETAEIAVRASITGHLVVSTLHTNSTAATVGRLIDMGIEPYLLGDSLVGIIAQRLVRRLCECKRPREATVEEKKMMSRSAAEKLTIYDPVGCQMCNGTGYVGRIGIYEIMTINQKIRNLIASRATADEIKKAAEEDGMSSLRSSAAKYVCEGVTSIAELMKTTYNADEE